MRPITLNHGRAAGAIREPTKRLCMLGVIGGSGFTSLMDDATEYHLDTPFGPPSDIVTIGEIDGREVAFLPRHGRDHRYPPHTINYRANVWALDHFGVTRILAPTAAGSLHPSLRPGHLALPDGLVDRTTGRADTFGGMARMLHPLAEIYCPELRRVALSALRDLGTPVHDGGTVVVIQGPRFSTRAESQWFVSSGFRIVNMTQYPEALLARELGMCYANVSLITDYDAGIAGETGIEPVTMATAVAELLRNVGRVREALHRIVAVLPVERSCLCATTISS